MKFWAGYGLNIPVSKTDTCIHTAEGHPDTKCYESLMLSHLFGLIKDDACRVCGLYEERRPKGRK